MSRRQRRRVIYPQKIFLCILVGLLLGETLSQDLFEQAGGSSVGAGRVDLSGWGGQKYLIQLWSSGWRNVRLPHRHSVCAVKKLGKASCRPQNAVSPETQGAGEQFALLECQTPSKRLLFPPAEGSGSGPVGWGGDLQHLIPGSCRQPAGLAIHARTRRCSRSEVTPGHLATCIPKQKSKLFMWFQADFCQFLFWQIPPLPWTTPRTASWIRFIASDF